MSNCVNYGVLFSVLEAEYKNGTFSGRISISDTVINTGECVNDFNTFWILCITLALFFWLFWLVKVMHSAVKNYEVRRFYHTVLGIYDSELPDITWNKDILPKITKVQQEVELCVHKSLLTELDICQRILRTNNYMSAMVYRSPEPLIPFRLGMLCFGDYFYVSTGLKACLEMILFWRGPFSPFDSSWHLRDDYRRAENRDRLAQGLRQRAAFLGVINFVFLPIIFLWQLLYLFLSYTQLIRKDPTWLGARRWSHYGKLYGRLFNELDHQLEGRMQRAYPHARSYMQSFPTHPLLIIFARGCLFFSSSILAVLFILTFIDNEVVRVDGMLTFMTCLGIVATISGALLPDENLVYAPDMLLTEVQRHYRHLPDEWLPRAHSRRTRDEFAALFQYKAIWLLEELISPFMTAYILLFKFPSAALPIVDFFRNFTVDVVGVGDVCSFSLMNVAEQSTPDDELPRHGAGQGGIGYGATQPSIHKSCFALQQAPPEVKAEMSLAQFALSNPGWRPDGGQTQRIVVSRVRNDAAVQQQQQALTSMMLPRMPVGVDMPESFKSGISLDPTSGLFYSAGAMSSSRGPLRGAGVSRLDDYPSFVAPVMDRRNIMSLSGLEGTSLVPRILSESEHAQVQATPSEGKEHPMSKSGPAAVVEEQKEVDPFASLVPLGEPQWRFDTMEADLREEMQAQNTRDSENLNQPPNE